MANNHFQSYLSPEEWLLHEKNIHSDTQSQFESLFTLGNGYVGSRGIYEERPAQSDPGTFFAGMFDLDACQVAALINAPNPFFLAAFFPQGEKLSMFHTPTEQHERLLDLQRGLLYRKTIFKAQDNNAIDLQSMRFVSMADLHVAVCRTVITSLNTDLVVTIEAKIDTDIKNQEVNADVQAFTIQQQEQIKDAQFLLVKSLDGRNHLAYAQLVIIEQEQQTKAEPTAIFEINLKKNRPLTITQFTVFFTTKDTPEQKLQKVTLDKLDAIGKKSFSELLTAHCKAFRTRWDLYDIEVGCPDLQLPLRFNLYQLMIAANVKVPDVSVAAKTLSGEGYKGHIFWEADLLLQPGYLFHEPQIARHMLEYRYNRMAVAKKATESKGFKGVLFPWESADTGVDETPTLYRDFDGTIHHVHTGHNSLHVNVAIFYALYQYYLTTDDTEFMLEKGLSMMIEMTRFWKSRVVHNRRQDLYKLKTVMGPDEFHEQVNNNAYTNQMVAWSFDKMLALITKFQMIYPDRTKALLKKHKLYMGEIARIKRISQRMYIPREDDIVIQFDHFLKLKPTGRLVFDANGMPTFPADTLVMDLFKTQYIKQPDVILLLLLLPGYFNYQTAHKNFEFYDQRTLHKSSWSTPVHSAVAAQLGILDKAYHYLLLTVDTDIKDLFSNTREGIHGPTVGGTWVAVGYGLVGLRATEDRLLIMPKIPPQISSIELHIVYRNVRLLISFNNFLVTVNLEKTTPPRTIRLQVCSKVVELQTGASFTTPLEATSIFETSLPAEEKVSA